jgi:hypothetical protein
LGVEGGVREGEGVRCFLGCWWKLEGSCRRCCPLLPLNSPPPASPARHSPARASPVPHLALGGRQALGQVVKHLLQEAHVIDPLGAADADGALPKGNLPELAELVPLALVGGAHAGVAARLRVDDDGLVAEELDGLVPLGDDVGPVDGLAGLHADVAHGGPEDAVEVDPQGELLLAVEGLGEEDLGVAADALGGGWGV